MKDTDVNEKNEVSRFEGIEINIPYSCIHILILSTAVAGHIPSSDVGENLIGLHRRTPLPPLGCIGQTFDSFI